MPSEYEKRVARLLSSGLSAKEICEVEKVSQQAVSAVKCRLKREARALALGQFSEGDLLISVGLQSPELQKWLLRQIPEGASLAELAVSFIVDRYHEETNKD